MFLILGHLGLCWPWGDIAPQGQPVARDKRCLLCVNSPPRPFPSPHLSHCRPSAAHPEDPRAGYQTPRGSLWCSEPTAMSQLASPKPGSPACLFLSTEASIEVLAHIFPLPLFPLGAPSPSPHHPVIAPLWEPPSLRNCGQQSTLLRQSLPDVMASLCTNSNISK